ncbi:MAG TPA: undecaprenyl-diphosphatase UppP [Candidatus Binataceae bacterium]|nr:undecaprenyl-diphosphatase UppP [Candidatus Binataceae bacterium]
MISTFHSIALGIVQGLTAFLPVSSEAHLILVPWLMNWTDQGLAFDLAALHLGTLMALLIYYWREWLDMGLSLASGREMPRRLLFLLIIGTIPAAVAGALLQKEAETLFRSPLLIAATLAIFGILLGLADKISARNRPLEEINLRDALVIGLSQALAIIPGVSRSGITITAASLLGLDREAAANFSFLMAGPIVAGAVMLELHKMIHAHLDAQLGWGFAASAIFGVLAIAALLKFLRTRTYQPFAIYRVALAVIVAAVWLVRLA